MPARPTRDRGAAALLVVFVVVAIGLTSVAGLLPAATATIEANRARTAADAAALAGAESGRPSAERVATANGGQLVGWIETFGSDGRTVIVEVRVGDAVAAARATTEP